MRGRRSGCGCRSSCRTPSEESVPEEESTESTGPLTADIPAENATEAAKAIEMVTVSSPAAGEFSDRIAVFSEQLDEKLEGYDLQYFGENALGSPLEMFHAMANNEVDLIIDGTTPITVYAPDYAFLKAPFLLRNAEQMQALIDGPVFEAYSDMLAYNNITIIGGFACGSRSICANGTWNMYYPATIKAGLPDSKLYELAFEEIGTQTFDMEDEEIYSAMLEGEINTAEATYTRMLDDHYYEVADTLYDTRHLQEFYCVYASRMWYDSLSDEDRAVVDAETAAFMEETAKWMLEKEEESRETLIKNGMKPDEEMDIDGLFETVRPVWEEKFELGEWAFTYDELIAYANGEDPDAENADEAGEDGETEDGEDTEEGTEEKAAPDEETESDDGAGISMGGIYNDGPEE